MRVAVVSPYPVPPATNGASVRVETLTRWLHDRGHDIHFVWAQTEQSHRDTDAVRLGLRRRWGSSAVLEHRGRPDRPQRDDWGLDDWVDPAQEKPFRWSMDRIRPDVVLVNYVFLSRFAEWAPSDAMVVLDTHDRLSRRAMYEEAGMTPGFFYTTEEEELRGCARADVVLAIQDGEVDHFRAAERPVVTVGHPEPAAYGAAPRNPRPVVGMVAAYNKFNATSVLELFEELERTDVLAQHDAVLHLAGNLVRGLRQRSLVGELPDRVVDVGFVDDLDEFYAGLDVVLNPTVVGTGLKIKTVEALSRGVPLVSTTKGADGLPRRDDAHWAPDMSTLVAHLGEALEDDGRRGQLANVSRHLHTEYLLRLDRNLSALFDPRAVEESRNGTLDRYLRATTGALDGSDTAAPLQLDTPVLPGRDRVSIAHVLNPVPAGFASDLYAAQPITFESMRRARHHASAEQVDVDLVSCLARTDDGPRPHGFRTTALQARVASDVGTFAHPRPLPVLEDVLRHAGAETDADWLVYTNADIGVMPHFYAYVAERIRAGHDALVINRRTVARDAIGVADLNAMYSQVGEDHPGFDCFVFRRDLLDRFEFGNVLIGVHLIGRVLLWNVLAHARNPDLVADGHLTFHLGDDNAGKRAHLLDYTEHNTAGAIDVLERFAGDDRLAALHNGPTGVFDPRTDNVAFDAATLRSGPATLDPVLAERPVMIHALFRTGSTWLWRRIRGKRLQTAWYEPLHEDLALIRPEALDHFRGKHALDTRHRMEGDWFFSEYEPLLDDGVHGVARYRRRFAYECFADNGPQPQLRAYIDQLVEASGPTQPVLQFNRTALRQRWFHEQYPHAHHLYLARDPRHQWGSYVSFHRDGARGFSRNDALIAGMNAHRPLVAPLGQLVELVRDDSRGNFFARYDEVWDGLTWPERYAMFYYLWLQGLLEAAATGSHLVSMDDVATDRWARMRLENHLAVRGIQSDLSALRMTTYEPDDLAVAPPMMEAVERLVQATVGRAFGLGRVHALPARWSELAAAVTDATLDESLEVQPVRDL